MRGIKNIVGVFLFVAIFALGFIVLKPITTSAGVPVNFCDVYINLIANPQNGTEFTFIPTPGEEFVLSVPGDTSQNFNVPINGSLLVTEIVPEGWGLFDIDCESIGNIDVTLLENGVSLDNCGGADVTCEFINQLTSKPIPALSQWGLIAAAAVLGVVGVVFYSRRRVSA